VPPALELKGHHGYVLLAPTSVRCNSATTGVALWLRLLRWLLLAQVVSIGTVAAGRAPRVARALLYSCVTHPPSTATSPCCGVMTAAQLPINWLRVSCCQVVATPHLWQCSLCVVRLFPADLQVVEQTTTIVLKPSPTNT
jgi:hypothetical protein